MAMGREKKSIFILNKRFLICFFVSFFSHFHIPEFLASVFPNCDLSEYGNEWKTCVSDIRCLIHDLYSETKDSSVSYFSSKYGNCCANPYCTQLQN
jgi:hypothetical protein